MIWDVFDDNKYYKLSYIEDITRFSVSEICEAIDNGELKASIGYSEKHGRKPNIIKGSILKPWLKQKSKEQWKH